MSRIQSIRCPDHRCSRDKSIVITADALERATRLLARQGRDGLWRDFDTPAGEASQWPPAFIGTALPLGADTTEALEKAADTLVDAQNPDGGWGYNEDVPSDADSTAWVMRFDPPRP
jgi:hypothetical protein